MRLIKIGLTITVVLVLGYLLLRWFVQDAYFRPENNPPSTQAEPSFIRLPENVEPTSVNQ